MWSNANVYHHSNDLKRRKSQQAFKFSQDSSNGTRKQNFKEPIQSTVIVRFN